MDRLDYTKGIIERLAAYDLAFRTRRIDPDDVHIVQIAQPSRTNVVDGADPRSVADGLVRAHGLEPHVRHEMARRRAMAVRSWTAHDWATSFLAASSNSPSNLLR